ncbi:helix-turn-helix domain-containing protein [Streptomyces orinoci]|uniref:Helix-turn-helix domain-containing protein n=1 Tax=Streptomyces orinoci TaxID=67339 RepID=A0ABV3K2V3_STRON|nr:helix-turn-helix domain-containing protein [Streptomyces orinoci]
MTSRDDSHTPATFAHWLKEQLRLHRYADRGGQTRFAADSGISPATVSRLLRGDGLPDLRTLNALSEALQVPLSEILVRAGVLSPEDLARTATRPIHPESITPTQAARELGITSPEGVKAFERMVNGLRATEPDDKRASG